MSQVETSHALSTIETADDDRQQREQHNAQQGLLRLPAELRVRIYSHLSIRTIGQKKDRWVAVQKSNNAMRPRPLSRVCRALYQDLHYMFYEHNGFMVNLMPENDIYPAMDINTKRLEDVIEWLDSIGIEGQKRVAEVHVVCPPASRIRYQRRGSKDQRATLSTSLHSVTSRMDSCTLSNHLRPPRPYERECVALLSVSAIGSTGKIGQGLKSLCQNWHFDSVEEVSDDMAYAEGYGADGYWYKFVFAQNDGNKL